jgi:gamma-glutamyltranspeptidase/glutathione hydrolase
MWRQWGFGLAVPVLAAALAACGDSNKAQLGEEGFVGGFYGGVAADEPRAVLVGRDVLSAGGTAGDAAVAMAFTLTATMPSRASLGGGGVCIVHEPKAMKTEALDFLPRAPAQPGSSGAPSIAVPGMARGLFALHARTGRLRWEELIAPGERLARFGVDVSRAFARDLTMAMPMLARDSGAQSIFGGPSGAPLAAGERLRQLDLAGLLGRIRAEGPGALSSGAGAQAYVAGVRALGGAITAEDLRDYRPLWQPTIKQRVGSHVGHFAPSAVGGIAAAELWAILGDGRRYDGTRADERPHLLVEATSRSGVAPVPLDARGRIEGAWVDRAMQGYDPTRHIASPTAPGAASEEGQSTGFVALDRDGGAVACTLTAGKLFGADRIVPGTGVVAAVVPDAATLWSLASMIVVNENSKDSFLVLSAGSDASAPVALASVALKIVEDGDNPADAINAPRASYSAAIDATLVESSGDAIARALATRGHRIGRVNALARVNGMYCKGGVKRDPGSCSLATDPRGLGLASGAEQ